MAKDLRRAAMGVTTVLGLARRGFFIPYRHADDVRPPEGAPAYPALATLFEGQRDAFRDLLEKIDGFAADLEAIGGKPPPEPRWDQDWFPGLDAASAYTLVRTLKPSRIVEVGSGHSTRFLLWAVTDGKLDTRITAIDPAPRASLDSDRIETIRATLRHAGTSPFEALRAGDMAVIDSSHILMPGTDVDLLLNGVLPSLPAGVLVHVHDIFLPDGYPTEWNWRGYNEQQGVGALLAGGSYEILFASHYVRTRMADEVSRTVLSRLPMKPRALESSLWLRKRG